MEPSNVAKMPNFGNMDISQVGNVNKFQVTREKESLPKLGHHRVELVNSNNSAPTIVGTAQVSLPVLGKLPPLDGTHLSTQTTPETKLNEPLASPFNLPPVKPRNLSPINTVRTLPNTSLQKKTTTSSLLEEKRQSLTPKTPLSSRNLSPLPEIRENSLAPPASGARRDSTPHQHDLLSHKWSVGGVNSDGSVRLSKSTAQGVDSHTVPAPQSRKLPPGCEQLLTNWLKNHPTTAYDLNQIEPALEEFKSYDCDWQKLKEECNSTITLQIINNLRSAAHDEIFEIIGKKKNEFGRKGLLSDYDFAFEIGKYNQADETKAVKLFNQLFEAKWGAPSSVIFDANAYTMQYIITARSPERETQRCKMQNEGSLLMKRKYCSDESWQSFKESVLTGIGDPKIREAKEAEFSRIELKHDALDDLLDKRYTAALGNTPFNKLKDLKITLQNELHEEFKTASAKTEKSLGQLVGTLERLGKAEINQDEFTALFNNQISDLLASNEEELKKAEQAGDTNQCTELSSKIEKLKSSIIDNPAKGKALMEAYQDRHNLDFRENQFHQNRCDVEKNKVELAHLQEKQLSGSLEGQELLQMSKLTDELNKEQGLNRSLNMVNSRKEGLIEETDRRINNCLEVLIDAHDIMVLEMQKSNILGMCFAQEAHVSEGAFAFVVLNIQAGKSDVRTIDHYTQAFREISGFYRAHQENDNPSHEKIVGASKYGDRLMRALSAINSCSNSLGIPPPNFGNVNVQNLEKFLKKLIPKYGIKLENNEHSKQLSRDVTQYAKDCGIMEKNDIIEFDKGVLNNINNQFDNISSALESWVSNLKEDDRNLYYRVS